MSFIKYVGTKTKSIAVNRRQYTFVPNRTYKITAQHANTLSAIEGFEVIR